MRAQRIILRTIQLRLREPFRISSGVTHDRTIMLAYVDFGGVEGVAECVAGETPHYSPETVETARWVIERHLGPALLGRELGHPSEVAAVLNETSPERCGEALELDAARVVNIKPGRLGGHGPSLRVHDLCERASVPVWCGGMLESGVGRAHNVALASLPNMRLPGDTSASARYWERDVVVPAFELAPDGTVAVPTGPGLGVELNEDFLRSIEVDRVVLR